MKVLKFGGTSVGTPASILNLKNIVCSQPDDCIVVVSALGGITDQLIRAANEALNPEGDYEQIYGAIVDRHHAMIGEVIAPEKQQALLGEVDALLRELGTILLGVRLVHDLSDKSLAAVVSYGERISSRIVTALLPGAVRANSCHFIKTQGKALQAELTDRLVKEALGEHGHLTVCPGFISTDAKSGEITNLGRGGSDYTAAIIAAALDADVLEIWTDVDGFMTADPRVIKQACTISELSYQEATELCNFGAKVVYPPTIYPVCAKHIPIRILNTLHPEAEGTVIATGVHEGDNAIRGISSIRGVALLTVSGLSMVGVIGVNRRIFTALAGANVSVFMVCQASSENSTSLGIQEKDCDVAVEVLNREFAREISIGSLNPMTVVRGLAAVSVVGEKMRTSSATAGQLFRTLSEEQIRVIAFAQGALGMNISLIVPENVLGRAMNVLHDSFFGIARNVLRVMVCGTGTVGGALLEQLRKQQPLLAEKEGLELRVVGIMSSKHALVNKEGICLDAWQQELQTAPLLVLQEAASVAGASVFVDCTASAEVASQYADLLKAGVSIVAANKAAASGPEAEALKLLAKENGVKFLYETNAGAGLPIIGTIRDMVRTGDTVLKIEAVLSGTLNFVCNRLAEGCAYSAAVAEAKARGYSEPDPRIDLSGEDVRKKTLILAREAGWQLRPENIRLKPFAEVDSRLTAEAFLEQLPKQDCAFEGKRGQLRYVASIEADGKGGAKAEVGLREVDEASPLYRLADAENIVMIRSVRYDLPLIVRGYGAGAEVTAAGVFADILKI
ncbi:MAG: bifunctional aspartate kinase/homoserine dehydrogenase I [Bacteroidales bacterium]|nr:bifunctional aspartate kinase/homoserine dehydrogenase I [Candidatus Colicola faecequi]